MREETRCRHMGYSFRLTARVHLYAPSHRQDSTYHGLCYTSRGALAGTRNSSMGSPHEGSIRRPIAPWANALTTELHLAPWMVRCKSFVLSSWSWEIGSSRTSSAGRMTFCVVPTFDHFKLWDSAIILFCKALYTFTTFFAILINIFIHTFDTK